MNFNPDLRPAVFVDRDGTLIEEVNFLHRVEDLRIFDFTPEALKRLKSHCFRVIVITNQSGIGRGYFQEQDMVAIHEAVQERLGGLLDAFYFCPHLPDDGCKCRKPRTGMIEQALMDFPIDLGRSWMVGDKAIDILTGQNAGLRTAMVLTGYGERELSQLESPPTIVAADLGDAVRRLLEIEESVALL